MLDWKTIVREKLGHLPLGNGRQEEVIEELAQQLESAYEEALANGANEPEALRRSLAQFSDWEKLRSEVFRSVEGTRLPVWEQRGIFSPSRSLVWIALALTLVLFALPAFRHALAFLPVLGGNLYSWDSLFSEKSLRRIEQSHDQQKYARALAFVALHSPDDPQAMHAAEKAIALDPRLTWISARVSHATYLKPGYDPHPWIERLKAWDPQNAFPYILEASASVHSDWESRWAKYSPLTCALRSALAAEPAWRRPMEKAFAAPRIDFYGARQFALDRQVLQEQGLDRPDMLVFASSSQPMPDFLAMELYADFQMDDVGAKHEKAGRTALAAYWNVALFEERLAKESTNIGQICSVESQKRAYGRIIRVLRREGRLAEATAVEATVTALPDKGSLSRQFPLRSEGSAARSARIVSVSAFCLVIFGIATGFWLLSVPVLKWRPTISSGLNRMASILCFAPPALLLAAFTLSVSYYPYAQSIARFASEKELMDAYAPFLFNVMHVTNLGDITEIWLPRMFWPLIWCAGIALAGALLLRWVAHRERPDRPGVA